jgi:hypothetical protein
MTNTPSEVAMNDLIRGILAVRGVSQGELAEALGVVQSSVSLRLSGGQDWRLSELRTVADFLKIDIATLVTAAPDVASLAALAGSMASHTASGGTPCRTSSDTPSRPPVGTEVRIIEAKTIVGSDDPPWTGVVQPDQPQPGRLLVRVTQARPERWVGQIIYADAWELTSEPPTLRLPAGWERLDTGHLRCVIGFGGHGIVVTSAGRIGIDLPGSTASIAARHIAARLTEAADIADQIRAGATPPT